MSRNLQAGNRLTLLWALMKYQLNPVLIARTVRNRESLSMSLWRAIWFRCFAGPALLVYLVVREPRAANRMRQLIYDGFPRPEPGLTEQIT